LALSGFCVWQTFAATPVFTALQVPLRLQMAAGVACAACRFMRISLGWPGVITGPPAHRRCLGSWRWSKQSLGQTFSWNCMNAPCPWRQGVRVELKTEEKLKIEL
jgi:hypothetical protein